MKKWIPLILAVTVLVFGTAPAQEKEKMDMASVFSRFPVKFYGFVKLDMSWDDSRTNPGNFVKWVDRESPWDAEDDSQQNITANATRFGFDIGGPESDKIKTGGKFELDFYCGGGLAENKPSPRMRHAYLWAEWVDEELMLLAGQSWDLVGYKNFAKTLNFLGGWFTGNIGFRHPQLRVQKTWQMGEERTLVGAVALSRTIGDLSDDPPFHPRDTGEDSDIPTVQARLALHMPLLAGKAMFALSGHFGTEEYDTNAMDESEDYDSWSVCLDFNLPLHKNLKVNGCAFTGENLDDMFAGIGQGVNTTTMKEIASQGGFLNLCLVDLVPDWQFNAGFCVDDPKNDDLNKFDRHKNMNVYGNAKYWITKDLMAALEVSYWQTQYIGVEDESDALRVHFVMQYSF